MTPRGAPFEERTRVLTLPAAAFGAVRALAPAHNGELPWVKARERWLAYRRMHALIHNLATVAQLVGRTPVRIFDAASEVPALLAPGDSVRLAPIELDAYERLERCVAEGRHALRPESEQA